MRPVSFNFATQNQNEVCATNTTAASGTTIVLDGTLSRQVQGTIDTSQRYVQFPGLQRPVQVFSTGNISTSTFSFTGLDINGYAISTSFAGPSGSGVIAKSTSEFSVVYTASVGNTAASSPFTIGFGPSGTTAAVIMDNFANPMNISYVVVMAATSCPVTFQHTFDNTFTATAPTWSAVTLSGGGSFASQTTATGITLTENPFAARVLFLATAAATGVVQVSFSQSGT